MMRRIPLAAVAGARSLPLCLSGRCFVQGGPGPRPQDPNELFQVTKSHRDEMNARHRQKMEAQERYYATQVGRPAPLPENAFEKGKFGMRRRLHRERESGIDLVSLGQAVDDGVNAMRK